MADDNTDFWFPPADVSVGANDYYNSSLDSALSGNNYWMAPPSDYGYMLPSYDPTLIGAPPGTPSPSFGYQNPISQWNNQGTGMYSPVGPAPGMNQNPYGGGWGAFASNPATILGSLGALAPLIGTLISGGKTGSQTPVMSNAQKGGINSAAGLLGNLYSRNTPLQKQQTSLLDAIASGKGLDQNYARAIEQAFEPQMGALYKQAANAGASRGFYDSPATSPVGGAILGPGLADLQGQIAAQKIAAMFGLPGLYTAPIQQQLSAAQGYGGLYSNYPRGVQGSQPMWSQIGTGIGGTLLGLGGAFAQNQNAQNQWQFQNQQQQQQNQFQNQFLQYLQNSQKTQDQTNQSQNLFGNYQVPDYQLQTNWPQG